MVQRFIPADGRPDSTRVKLLALTLVVGLAACLLNPHHVRAFTVLPTELDPNVTAGLQKDSSFWPIFVWPGDVRYRNRSELGYNIPGFSYAALLALGLISFGLNYKQFRMAHALTWLAMAALTAFPHQRQTR